MAVLYMVPFGAGEFNCELSYRQAQPWCNFVLYDPGDSIGYQEQGRLRPEIAPSTANGGTTSTYRELRRAGSMLLSIKQFFYDWAPPAFDHPSLWLGGVEPLAFVIGRNIGWIGRNYREQPAASIALGRTLVEVTALSGSAPIDHLLLALASMRPVDEPWRAELEARPFGELSYLSRHPKKPVRVPLSYWDYQRSPEMGASVIVPPHLSTTALPCPRAAVAARGYDLDTAVFHGEPPMEIDWIFENKAERLAQIRVLASPFGASLGIPVNPVPGRQPCTCERLEISGVPVHYAYLRRDLGSHEAVFSTEHATYLALVQPIVSMEVV